MREIKFRAWDKVNNKMQHSGIVWGYSINPKYKDIRFPVLEGFDYGDNIYNLSNIMQYTGLKDKNGVEIYELCELNNKYRVLFKDLKYVLQDISNSDIIDMEFNSELYEITREYSPI